MATQKKNEFRIKFPSGREAVFGIRNGEVRKISRPRLSDPEFRQALNEARKVLLNPEAEAPNASAKASAKVPRFSPKNKQILAGAAAHEFHLKKSLPDF